MTVSRMRNENMQYNPKPLFNGLSGEILIGTVLLWTWP